MKKTVIIGSTGDPGRYDSMAAAMLAERSIDFVPLGIRGGQVSGKEIQPLDEEPMIESVDTITLYIHPEWQKEWYTYILSLRPKRIIFNPGTENKELEDMARKKGIECVIGCTLVMLSVGNY